MWEEGGGVWWEEGEGVWEEGGGVWWEEGEGVWWEEGEGVWEEGGGVWWEEGEGVWWEEGEGVCPVGRGGESEAGGGGGWSEDILSVLSCESLLRSCSVCLVKTLMTLCGSPPPTCQGGRDGGVGSGNRGHCRR